MTGSIERYETKSGPRYAARWRGPDRRQKKRKGFVRKREAQAFLARVQTEMRDGRYIDPQAGRASVGELGPAWLKRRRAGVNFSTWRTYESAWRLHVEPRWGRVPVGVVRKDDVEDWIAEFVELDASHTQIDRNRSVLSGILREAVAARRIADNPAENLSNMPRKTSRDMRILTAAQLRALADGAGPHRDLVLTLGLTGIRWGEAVALQTAHVDLVRRRIRIVENAVEAGGQILLGLPKSHERREVSAPLPLLERLARAAKRAAVPRIARRFPPATEERAQLVGEGVAGRPAAERPAAARAAAHRGESRDSCGGETSRYSSV